MQCGWGNRGDFKFTCPDPNQSLNHKNCKWWGLVNIVLWTHAWHYYLSRLRSGPRKSARKEMTVRLKESLQQRTKGKAEKSGIRYAYINSIWLDFLRIVWTSLLPKLNVNKIKSVCVITLSNCERHHFRYKESKYWPQHTQDATLNIFN